MITEITLQNFKLFKEKTSFPLNQLNLLTGVNGGGKSTLLQSLLLMRQSIEHDEWTTKILFNGSCVELGTFEDVKNSEVSRREEVILGYRLQKWREKIKYSIIELTDDYGISQINKINTELEEFIYGINGFINTSSHNDIETISLINLIPRIDPRIMSFPGLLAPVISELNFHKIHYIAADRIGPQKYYEKQTLGNFINVGPRGEHTANVLYKLENELVDDKLYLGNDAKTLIQQTEEWLGKIFGKAKIELKGKEKEHTVLNLLLNTTASQHRYRPSNVGFGYTYILPIIVSGLIAKEGEMLIVENPEAHLHPKAQAELTKFLAKVASCGVQVFIESHSEHILNAIRIATLREDIAITHEQVSVLYFHNQSNSYFKQLKIEKNGKINDWIDGFFDQQEMDLAEIFRLGKRKK